MEQVFPGGINGFLWLGPNKVELTAADRAVLSDISEPSPKKEDRSFALQK
jgi:hypothetical protein